jgi:hypothetical protein
MKLVLAKTMWGVDGGDDEDQWDSIFGRIAEDGYTMIECVAAFSFGGAPERGQKFANLAAKHKLKVICNIHTTGGYFQDQEYVYCSSFELETHLNSVKKEIELAMHANPVHINCHGGVDAWDHETMVKFLLGAIEIAKEANISISFETHRQRIFCNPFQTRSLLADERLKGNEELKITADLSHWVVSCERQLHTPSCWASRDPWWQDLLEQVAFHVTLIHCRVGYPQGPQVPDVTDPAYKKDVKAHLDMWGEIWNIQRKKGFEETWCELEHGAAPYLQTLPHTGQPVADLWKVNNDLAKMIRVEYQDVDDVISLHASMSGSQHF